MVKEDNTFENNLIRIGQNAEENDQIISEAKQTDLWFHLANLPSCHIIMSCSNEFPVTKQMITYCCQLTKENTKYRDLPKVKVNYTIIKNVKKTEVKGKVILKGKLNEMTV
ncbi:DUF814 protein [Fadolivirus algeromassiliense]|jgi:predicted ribosome quality control (RQC) complex YloA/Tae2 family protein|uniref:DUF814 protein n=1 Tax=Fadolivirus FV1/VV64 TaxID=3070911 RepID=A0A7D3UUG3_9VIRU|nr:DUF814 protein [Fadolivirus algeromassiliense]QKF94131.1 DUF814 protein [Fadolivirus FV1/VV64]